jgi:hypothetical protein
VQLAFVQVATQSETLGATPSGWTKLGSAVNTRSADSAQTAVYATTTDTGPTTFTKSGSRGWLITRVAYTGTAGAGASAIERQGYSSSHAAPPVAAGADDLVVGLVGSDRGTGGAAQSWTPPSGWTERQDTEIAAGRNPDLESETIADAVGAQAGTFTAAVPDDAIAASVVVQGGDASPPPPAPPPTSTAPSDGWTNVIDDQFNADGPVPSHWDLYDGRYGSGPRNCANPSHATVSGGALHLLMSWDANWCAPNGGWETAGMQIAPAYGGVDQRVTLRWRIVQDGVSDHHIIPMRFPDDPGYQWFQGESDYCEGSGLTGCTTFLHYADPGQVQHDYAVDLTQWHTWRFEQDGDQVTAYVDDLDTPAWTYSGTATTVPASFRRTVLQQECRSSGCPAGTTGTSDIQIDWITIDDKA